MRQRRLIWHIFPSYVLVILTMIVLTSLYSTQSLRSFYKDRWIDDLEARARILGVILAPLLADNVPETVHRDCRALAEAGGMRVTVTSATGAVAGDSEEDPALMENHAGRPEVAAALAGEMGAAVRLSTTIGKEMLYVAVPVRVEGRLLGVVRVAVPAARIDDALWSVYLRVAMGGVVAAVMAGLLSWFVAGRLSRAIEEMKRGAERFAEGDFSHPLALASSQEMASLAEALNRMARQLDDRIRTVISQRNQQEAVLSSMVEGVLAVDTAGNILSLNAAAAQLIGAGVDQVQGCSFREAVANETLAGFVEQALLSAVSIEDEFLLPERGEQILQVSGTPLRDARGENIGAVVVLNDVTRLRRLEQVRRDFVANVSHELRTPITSIKGFVETLLDGALDRPGDAKRFLQIVAKQADRLNAILGDLLTLSRIEEGEEKVAITLELGALRPVLEAAVQLCEKKGAKKDVEINLECEESLSAAINPPLLEQAVANLVDNAVKYSDQAGEIWVRAFSQANEVVVQVEDQGCGIPAEHLPRLFERFYRVDKARSRSLGGTGLGLSIVKHIAKAHHGRVSVESTPGRGSLFRIHMPRGIHEQSY